MIDPSTHINKIFIEHDCAGLPYVEKILERASGIPVEIIQGRQLPGFDDPPYPHNLHQGKKNLLLCRNRGHFFKPCPATREYRCCDYQVINIGMNCPMDCVYCILQAYLNTPWLSFFVNIDELLAELEAAFQAEPGRIWRIGTGEFTDSLVLDRLTGLSTVLIKKFRRHPGALLELKTKTVEVENLLSVDPEGHCLVSWSLNAAEVTKGEELKTARLEERLAAAGTVAENGYHLGFHFDPVIHYPGWEEGYRRTMELLFSSVPAEKIVWISVGAFRFLPELKRVAARRFPGSNIYYDEFITGLDGKCRYFRSLREELYDLVTGEIRKRSHPDTCIYFCMESDEIWKRVMGFAPEERGGLAAMLDAAAARALAGR